MSAKHGQSLNLGLGAALGIIFGLLFDNLAMGLAFGVLFALLFDAHQSKKRAEKTPDQRRVSSTNNRSATRL